jgi:hypothetical protein
VGQFVQVYCFDIDLIQIEILVRCFDSQYGKCTGCIGRESVASSMLGVKGTLCLRNEKNISSFMKGKIQNTKSL